MLFRRAYYQGAGSFLHIDRQAKGLIRLACLLLFSCEKVISLIKDSARCFFKLFLIKEISSLLWSGHLESYWILLGHSRFAGPWKV